MEDACNNSFNMLFSVGGGISFVLSELFWVSECLISEVHDCIVTVVKGFGFETTTHMLFKWKFGGEIHLNCSN